MTTKDSYFTKHSAAGLVTGGLDEVGWGALAGPIISAVAVFRPQDLKLLPSGVRDSKKCSEKLRTMLFDPIIQACFDIGLGHAWPWEIDSYGPFQALQLSYSRAIEELHPARRPNLLIVDGKNKVYGYQGEQKVEPKADVRYQEVSAASIVAKVFRDRIMVDYAKKFPGYCWEVNKGYGTPDHLAAIREKGLLVDLSDRSLYLHRQRFCQKLKKKGA
jgi:ribonuclease HII